MAAPAQAVAIWDLVVITVTTNSGVDPNNQSNVLTGYVEQVGLNVNRVAVGQTVLFKTDITFSESGVIWACVPQANIYCKINNPVASP